MGVVGWSMLVVHLALFFVFRRNVAKKKRVLEKDNAELRRDLIQAQTKIDYWKKRAV